MWIIIRFDEDTERQIFTADIAGFTQDGEVFFNLPEEGEIKIDIPENLIKYGHLLSLIIREEENIFNIESFIINPTVSSGEDRLSKAWFYFAGFGQTCFEYSKSDFEAWYDWRFFLFVLENLVSMSQEIEKIFDAETGEKLLYVGNILRIIGEDLRDIRFKLVLLTGVLELLLTRNPDTGRFNVEDSISKQFQLKTAIVVYLNDKTNNIDEIKKVLKLIYQQRSNVAHGNFREVSKHGNKKSEAESFEELVLHLQSFVRAVLQEYIADPKFINFIKEG